MTLNLSPVETPAEELRRKRFGAALSMLKLSAWLQGIDPVALLERLVREDAGAAFGVWGGASAGSPAVDHAAIVARAGAARDSSFPENVGAA